MLKAVYTLHRRTKRTSRNNYTLYSNEADTSWIGYSSQDASNSYRSTTPESRSSYALLFVYIIFLPITLFYHVLRHLTALRYPSYILVHWNSALCFDAMVLGSRRHYWECAVCVIFVEVAALVERGDTHGR